MAVNIELGSTEGFRHIGIQPPLTLRQIGLLNIFNNQHYQPVGSFMDEVPPTGLPYSEALMDIDGGVSKEIADQLVVHVAQQITEMFRASGISVVLNETIHDLETDKYLFAEQPMFVDQPEL